MGKFKKLKKHPARPGTGEKMPFNYRKTLKILPEKNIGHDGKRRVSGSRFTGHMIITARLGSNLKTAEKQTFQLRDTALFGWSQESMLIISIQFRYLNQN